MLRPTPSDARGERCPGGATVMWQRVGQISKPLFRTGTRFQHGAQEYLLHDGKRALEATPLDYIARLLVGPVETDDGSVGSTCGQLGAPPSANGSVG